MRIRLAPRAARDGSLHQACIQRILHIAFEDAVFNQHIALRNIAFVIDVQRAAPVGDGTIVNDGDTLRCDTFTNAPGKEARAFAVEIAFQPMPDGFVQQDARPARTQHDRHRPRRRGFRIQIDQRLAHRTFGIAFQYFIGEIAIVVAPATARVPLLAATVLLGNHGEADMHQRPDIRRHHAIASGDHHNIVFAGQAAHHLFHAWIDVAGELLKTLQNAHLVGIGKRRNGIARCVQCPTGFRLRRRGLGIAAGARNAARSRRRRGQCGMADVVRIRKGGFFAGHHAHTDALIDIEAARFDVPFLQAPTLGT